jgi:hypothetical protein
MSRTAVPLVRRASPKAVDDGLADTASVLWRSVNDRWTGTPDARAGRLYGHGAQAIDRMRLDTSGIVADSAASAPGFL